MLAASAAVLRWYMFFFFSVENQGKSLQHLACDVAVGSHADGNAGDRLLPTLRAAGGNACTERDKGASACYLTLIPGLRRILWGIRCPCAETISAEVLQMYACKDRRQSWDLNL